MQPFVSRPMHYTHPLQVCSNTARQRTTSCTTSALISRQTTTLVLVAAAATTTAAISVTLLACSLLSRNNTVATSTASATGCRSCCRCCCRSCCRCCWQNIWILPKLVEYTHYHIYASWLIYDTCAVNVTGRAGGHWCSRQSTVTYECIGMPWDRGTESGVMRYMPAWSTVGSVISIRWLRGANLRCLMCGV
jgi:hypothetical protein